MAVLDQLHGKIVHTRRVRVLAERLAPLFPPDATVLDVGCGDGLLAKLVGQLRPDLTLEGIDVLVREGTHVPVRAFDGRHIEAADRSYDAVMFVDVLHHTEDPKVLFVEAIRVARQCVIIKDHTRNGLLAGPTLRFMDWIGNARYGVALPYNYLSREQWLTMVEELGLKIGKWVDRLQLYPWWARWVFERHLHFIARMDVPQTSPS
jgi:2-polyprenyl-3-methyl-5-hydroxy-6-metoxy-1,4-benzoquinol methylase